MVVIGIPLAAYWLYATDGCSKPYRLPRFASGTKDKPVSLPDEERAKVTGNAGPNDGMLTAEIYNGSDWTLTRVDLNVIKSPRGRDREERRYQLGVAPPKPPNQYAPRPTQPLDPTAKPFSTVTFEASIGNFLDGVKGATDWEFNIPEAFGYKQ